MRPGPAPEDVMEEFRQRAERRRMLAAGMSYLRLLQRHQAYAALDADGRVQVHLPPTWPRNVRSDLERMAERLASVLPELLAADERVM